MAGYPGTITVRPIDRNNEAWAAKYARFVLWVRLWDRNVEIRRYPIRIYILHSYERSRQRSKFPSRSSLYWNASPGHVLPPSSATGESEEVKWVIYLRLRGCLLTCLSVCLSVLQHNCSKSCEQFFFIFLEVQFQPKTWINCGNVINLHHQDFSFNTAEKAVQFSTL